MLRQLDLFDDEAMKEWDVFVSTHPEGTPFHLSGWLRALSETYGYRPLLYVLLDAGEIVAVLPFFIVRGLFGRRLVSLPFSDYGGPLLKVDGSFPLDDAMSCDRFRGLPVEIRSSAAIGDGFESSNYYRRHVLDLSRGFDEVGKHLNKSTIAYNIRRAIQLGVKVREDCSSAGLDSFYRLNALTRKKHGIPSQPRRFFDKLFKHLLSKGLGTMIIADYQGCDIGAIIVLFLNGKVYYKYNASAPAFLCRLSPNHLMTLRLIEKGCSEGYHTLDFGRTASDNEGLMRYKQLWGATELEVPYQYRKCGSSMAGEDGMAQRAFKAAWRVLPASMTDRLGPWLMKYLG